MPNNTTVQVFKETNLGSILDTRYVSNLTSCDMVYNKNYVAIFRQCSLRNLRNAAHFFDLMFVAQHDEHEDFIVSYVRCVLPDLSKSAHIEREVKLALIQKVKSEWGVDLMKKACV